MFGHWVRQYGRWRRQNHLFLRPNNMVIVGRHSASQIYTLPLFTTFYESVLSPPHPVLIRATCSKYVLSFPTTIVEVKHFFFAASFCPQRLWSTGHYPFTFSMYGYRAASPARNRCITITPDIIIISTQFSFFSYHLELSFMALYLYKIFYHWFISFHLYNVVC